MFLTIVPCLIIVVSIAVYALYISGYLKIPKKAKFWEEKVVEDHMEEINALFKNPPKNLYGGPRKRSKF